MYIYIYFLSLITTYSPEFSGLKDIVTRNWDLLKHSSTTKVLAETKITFGYRRPPNLRDMLVRAKILQKKETSRLKPHCHFANKCNNKKCQFCPILNKSGRIVSSVTGREYSCKKDVTGKSNNIIYCITCKRCRKQYVGQTGDTLHIRISRRILDIISIFWNIEDKQTWKSIY